MTPDRLGSLWDGDCHPDLWFAAELVDSRGETSPKTHRWQQHAGWTAVRYAVAEAVALVAHGRRPETRATWVRKLSTQKSYPKKWLAALAQG
ncbi:hypothetical protein ACFY3U_01485 [Micromonospora sp. NPDC000089]|uniref:hypothetical protein n=1 Tax=unclassified Micromonospora TaxID=2617518 RepID=UPI0036761899